MIGRTLRVEGSIEMIRVVGRFVFLLPLSGLVKAKQVRIPGDGNMPDEHFIGST